MVLNCIHHKHSSQWDTIPLHFVTASMKYHCAIYAPAAFLRNGSDISGYLSEI